MLLTVHAGECAMPLGMVVTGLILPCLWSECGLVASQFWEVWEPSNPRGPDRALPFGWGHSSGSSYSSSWARRWKAGPCWHLPERWPLRFYSWRLALRAIWSAEIWERSNPRESGNQKLFGSVEKLPMHYCEIWKQTNSFKTALIMTAEYYWMHLDFLVTFG